MNRKRFSELCLEIKRAWNHKDGVLVSVRRSSTGGKTPMLDQCVGSLRNPDITARNCVVWQGDMKLYDGALCSTDLFRLQTDRQYCFCELLTARIRERGGHGVCMCQKNPSTCKKQCRLRCRKEKRHEKQPLIRSIEEAIQDSGNSE